ncbi:ChaC-like protein-domain-containing protein [Xylariaceae sp. FL0016]|nr:ChaC-like protein-domain-containing protein [Xylariaceae sp. FL0016]
MSSGNARAATPDDEFWLFGYGSLIWKPPPHYDRRIPGYVHGYVRRFWQASQDHRGTPAHPGRVATLIERAFWAALPVADPHDAAPDRVWGVAYRIEPARVAEVKEYLDIREINGYSIHYTSFHPAARTGDKNGDQQSETIRTLVYIGTPTNDQFVGPQDPQALAEHIYVSSGPSGPNRDYLLSLETALDALSPGESGDGHITDLSKRLRALDAQVARGELCAEDLSARVWARHEKEPEAHPITKVSSVEEQEETEKS